MSIGPAPATTYRAPNAMVAAPDHLAASAGAAMLRAGGSAVDAAIAASAVLAVTFQHACGMGGDLFALVHDGDAVRCLDASGRAGSAVDAERLRSDGLTAIPLRGHAASVTIPGCVDGWCVLHKRYGRLPLADVLGPAISYATDGFPASVSLSGAVPSVTMLPGAADYRDAGPMRPGTVIRRPGAANALTSIVEGGRDAFYRGRFGEGLVQVTGLITESDLERSQADWVEPLSIEAFGHRIWTPPPASQGYLTLAGAWIVGGLDLPGDPDDPLWAHLLIESARQAGYDRPSVLHEGADGAALLDPARLAPRRAAIEPDRTAPLGDTYRTGGTIFLCAVDADRMGVSLIQSNAAGWGSHLIEPSTRIFLQNRGVGFSLDAGHPAEIGPGRRPPHTLSPALVTSTSGELTGVLGSMGGDSQPQILLQLLARWLLAGEEPGQAVHAGRWALTAATGGSGFDTWRDGGEVAVQVEGHAPAGWAEGLQRRGHRVIEAPAYDSGFGWAQLIAVDGEGLAGGTDPRPRSGAAVGL